MKTVFVFLAGALVGSAVIITEVLKEKMIVNNNLDGTTTIHWRGAVAHNKSYK